ncbi:hypothetical protein [Paenibacillus agricola]|uniref:Uncharacterized protein n=1 Tax=Paenibacillus agricola TaxID=2716264 RepID=A0ABX0J3U7_9BACL|nr:hypothetical protein [Paenibacillus agricola]NHN29532.1 hypothetical protein [Paenibacillus agricola]
MGHNQNHNPNQNKAIQRVLEQSGNPDLLEIWNKELSVSDINTFLLELFRLQTKEASYADLLRKYVENRFVHPAKVDPIALKQLEIAVLQIAQSAAYQPILLSPIAPLGSCSIVATADQNKIISALRGTEVVADATNLLALYICDLLKSNKTTNDLDFVRFSTTHRHVRTQPLNKPGLLPHFHVFCLVASGKDQGSYLFEKAVLQEHIALYQMIFKAVFHADIDVQLSRRGGYPDGTGFFERILDDLEKRFPDISITENFSKTDNLYYKGLQFTIVVHINGQELYIGDGGFVDWPQKLLGNRKQRMMISAIGLDRLL